MSNDNEPIWKSAGTARRNFVVSGYEEGGDREDWTDKLPPGVVDKSISLLLTEGVLPKPTKEEVKIVIFSTSSNTGVFESKLKEELGEKYQVIASDLASLSRRADGKQQNLQADAFLPPLSHGSVNVIFDRRGALWHTSNVNEPLSHPSRAKQLLEIYRQKLKAGGVLIVDNDVGWDASTADLMAELGIDKPAGFSEPVVVGEKGCRYQVYTKLSKEI